MSPSPCSRHSTPEKQTGNPRHIRCPPELFQSWVGARYQVVLVQIGDDEQPTKPDKATEVDRIIQSAGMLPRLPQFATFMEAEGLLLNSNEFSSDDPRLELLTVKPLRNYLGVQSRSDLRTNSEALKKYVELRSRFQKWQMDHPI